MNIVLRSPLWEIVVISLDNLGIAGAVTLIVLLWARRDSGLIQTLLVMKVSLLIMFIWLLVLDTCLHLQMELPFRDYPLRPMIIRGPLIASMWLIVWRLVTPRVKVKKLPKVTNE